MRWRRGLHCARACTGVLTLKVCVKDRVSRSLQLTILAGQEPSGRPVSTPCLPVPVGTGLHHSLAFYVGVLQHQRSNLCYSLDISETFFPVSVSQVSVSATQELSQVTLSSLLINLCATSVPMPLAV